MKMRSFCAAAGALLSASVFAQSSVTVFGRLDVAARYTRNEGIGSLKSLANTGNSSSRFGVRGTEDLGGGLSAGFWLESSVGVDVGSGGASNSASSNQFWDRESFVFLAHKSYGQLRLGYDLTQPYNTWSAADPFAHVGVGGSGNLYQASQTGPIRAAFGSDRTLSTTIRSRNMVQYLLPAGAFGGLKGGLFVAPGEGGTVAGNAASKYMGASIGYVVGPVDVSGAYATTQNNMTGDDKFKEMVVTGVYAIGPAKLGVSWRRFDFRSAKQTLVMLSGQADFGVHTVKAMVERVNMAGSVGATSIDANDATQVAVGYVYNLSKRTALYTTYGHIDNKGAATNVVPGGPAVSAATFGGRSSSGLDIGLRHIF